VPQESIGEAWLPARYSHRDVSDFGISMSENARSGRSICPLKSVYASQTKIRRKTYKSSRENHTTDIRARGGAPEMPALLRSATVYKMGSRSNAVHLAP